MDGERCQQILTPSLLQSSTVGYLTMSKQTLPSMPPPIEDNHDTSDNMLG